VRFFVAGRITLVGPSGTVEEHDLPGVQGRLLVTALALERRPVPRDLLAEWLWPRRQPDDIAKSLNPLLSKVRQQLARLDTQGRCTVRSTSGCYELVTPSDIWIDVEDAITRLDRAEGALRRGEHAQAWPDATVAVSILRRDLLPGCESEWVDRRRDDLLARCYRGWLTLGIVWLHEQEYELARSATRAAIDLNPYREDGHRLAIQIEMSSGNRALATQAARRCRSLLRDELGVEPSLDTRELERQLGL
jgi:SARP family transcriptional regulator, regulator of embCAB operon